MTSDQTKNLNEYKGLTFFKYVQNILKIGSPNTVSEVNVCQRNRLGQNIHHQ